MKRKSLSRWLVLLMACITVLVLSACGSEEGATPNDVPAPSTTPPAQSPPATQPPELTIPEVTKDPVELNFFYAADLVAFEKDYMEPLQKKYPNFKLNHVKLGPTDALASNTHYDIIFNSITVVGQFLDAKLTTDMSDLVKKYNVDIDRFYPEQLDTMRLVAGGDLIGFPQKGIHQVLFYNRDLFDKFGQDYPRDGMTWEETLGIARAMTREDGGVQYLGFGSSTAQYLGQNQYGLSMVDLSTNQVTFGNEKWAKMIETIVPFYTMPGYSPTRETVNGATKLFRETQTLAMWLSDHTNAPKVEHGVNWDVVSAPDFADMRGAGPTSVFTYFLLSSNSKHPDEAFLAIDQLTSREIQIENARERLFVPTIRDQTAIDAFGQGSEQFAGVNMKAFFPDKFAEPIQFDTFYTTARNHLNNNLLEVILGTKDLNTAIRDATEAANKAIEERLAAAK